MRRGFECVFLLAVVAGIYQQWISPTVKNSFKVRQDGARGTKIDSISTCYQDGNELTLYALIDRTLKLSIPNNVLC